MTADVEMIVNAYGAVLAEGTAIGLVRDINSLPYSKDEIKRALKFALNVTTDKGMQERLRTGYVSLADFQQLSDAEVRALQEWNNALAQSQTSALDQLRIAKTVSAAAGDVTAIQRRIAAEAESLMEELRGAGF